MIFAKILCMAAGVAADHTFLPEIHRVPTGAVYNSPSGSCSTIKDCHECVLAGCSPALIGGGGMTCATPGGEHGGRPNRTPSYVELFPRAKICKDTKNICGSSQTVKGGLTSLSAGFKSVAAGSVDDVIVPTNYFCLVDFTTSEYSYMKVN